MSQALAYHNGQNILIPSITPDEISLVKNTIAQGATEAELKLYLYDCQRQGVHPLDRMIHFTKRGDKYTPIASIDFLRARAETTGEYAGNDDPVFDDEKNPQKATVTVYKIVNGQRCGFTASARWSQYFPGDKSGYMWKKMPHLMLGKCAEALALRKAFPKQFAGIYTSEEMAQTERVVPSSTAPNTDGLGHSPSYVPQVSVANIKPSIDYVSMAKDMAKVSSFSDAKHNKVVEQAKDVLGAKEISAEEASLLEMEPHKELDLTNPLVLQQDQPAAEFGNTKIKNKPYYENTNGNLLVYNGYVIKDKLKRNGFHWNGGTQTWNKIYSAMDEELLKEMIK